MRPGSLRSGSGRLEATAFLALSLGWCAANDRLGQVDARYGAGVTAAEFEEKQYECAFNVELGASGPVFASGQVLEKLTGYDTVADPGSSHVLWRILAIPRPPGIRLVPDHWSPAVRRM